MTIDLNAAESFLYANARLLERLRFAHLFKGASAEPVVHALRAHRNPAAAIEWRGVATMHALRVLRENGRI